GFLPFSLIVRLREVPLGQQPFEDGQELRRRLDVHLFAAHLDRERMPAAGGKPEDLRADRIRGPPETLLPHPFQPRNLRPPASPAAVTGKTSSSPRPGKATKQPSAHASGSSWSSSRARDES